MRARQGRKSIITEELINKIKVLKEEEYTILEISEMTGVSRSTVYKVLKKHLGYVPNKLIKRE